MFFVSCRTKLPLNCQGKTMGNSREEKYHRPINYTPIPEQIQFKIGKFIYRRKLDINSRACIRKSTVLERFVHLDLGCLPRGKLFKALGQGVVGRWKKNKGGVGVAEREKRQDGSPPLKEGESYNGNFMYGSWRWRTNEFMICSQFLLCDIFCLLHLRDYPQSTNDIMSLHLVTYYGRILVYNIRYIRISDSVSDGSAKKDQFCILKGQTAGLTMPRNLNDPMYWMHFFV